MKVNQNLHWFKKGIKPMWEDPRNKYGGRLTLCPPRSLLDTVWETVLILMAGDVLDYRGESTGAGNSYTCYNISLFLLQQEKAHTNHFLVCAIMIMIVFARRARGDRVEVWIGADDSPEALAHIRGVLAQELAASGADELVRTAKYKKHFDGRREEKQKAAAAAKEANAAAAAAAITGTPGVTPAGGLTTPGPSAAEKISTSTTPTMSSNSTFSGLSSPLLPTTPRMGSSSTFSSSNLSEFKTFEAFTQYQQQQQALREREREATKEQERIMQLGKERLEKERAEKDRLRDEKVRAMAAAAMAAAEAKHQERLQREREAAAAAASQS